MRKKNSKESTLALQRYRDIESGKVIPTFEEFFKICIILNIAEKVNLKELYPTLYDMWKRDIDTNAARMEQTSGERAKRRKFA